VRDTVSSDRKSGVEMQDGEMGEQQKWPLAADVALLLLRFLSAFASRRAIQNTPEVQVRHMIFRYRDMRTSKVIFLYDSE
jgi:hypothetical protein